MQCMSARIVGFFGGGGFGVVAVCMNFSGINLHFMSGIFRMIIICRYFVAVLSFKAQFNFQLVCRASKNITQTIYL